MTNDLLEAIFLWDVVANTSHHSAINTVAKSSICYVLLLILLQQLFREAFVIWRLPFHGNIVQQQQTGIYESDASGTALSGSR